MTVTPGSNKKTKNKDGSGTPQGPGAVTPKGASQTSVKTPNSQKGKTATPTSQKGQSQTPTSQKSKFQKGQTPKSEPKAQSQTPKGQGATATPQSNSGKKQKMGKPSIQQGVKSESPKMATPLAQKSPKEAQQKPSAQKDKTPNQGKGATPTAKLLSSNKKRKLEKEENGSDDSAEEDFEALIGQPKQLKTELFSTSPQKQTGPSPSKQTPGKRMTPQSGTKQRLTSPPKSAKDSAAKLTAGKKRALDDDDDDEDGSEDEDDDILPSKKPKTAPGATAKKLKMESSKTPVCQTSPAKHTSAILTDADLARDMKRRDALDCRLLFVKNIPKSATEAQIKALHRGITHVQLRSMKWSRQNKQQHQFAHIEFKDEKSTEEAYKALSGKSMEGRTLTVDYFGAKSSHASSEPQFPADQLDPCKLFVSRYPLDMTSEELKTLFPTASETEVLWKESGQPIGFAFVHFTSVDACRKAHHAADNMKVRGQTIMVVYARKKTGQPPAKQPPNQPKTSVATSKSVVGKAPATETKVAVVKGQQQPQQASAGKMSQPAKTTSGTAGKQSVGAAGNMQFAAQGDLDDDSEDDDDDEDSQDENDSEEELDAEDDDDDE